MGLFMRSTRRLQNFLMGMKYYAYSFALAEKDEVKYALVVDLENFDIYRAVKWEEATFNSEKLEGIRARFSCSHELAIDNVEIPGGFYLGCIALQFCALARGSFDFLIGRTCNIDIAAGYLIAREAGVEILDWNFKHTHLPIRERKEFLLSKMNCLKTMSWLIIF